MKAKVLLRSMLCVVLMGLLVFAAAAPAMAVVPSSSTVAPAGGTSYLVNCSALNVRMYADKTAPVMYTIKRGTMVTYLGNSNGWWRVSTPNGIGWVDKKYLAPSSTNAQTGTYTVTATKLNVRSYPRTTAKRIAQLVKGQSVAISELNGDWGYVPSLGGWVALAYLNRSTGAASGTTVSSVAVGGVYTITASVLNIRSGASTGYGITGTFRKGDSVTVSQISGNWAYVRSGSKQGWIYWKGYVG